MRLPADWRARVILLPVSVEMPEDIAFLDAIEQRLAEAGFKGVMHG